MGDNSGQCGSNTVRRLALKVKISIQLHLIRRGNSVLALWDYCSPAVPMTLNAPPD